MKRTMKRFMAFVLAAVMVLGMSMTAMAEETPTGHTLTIKSKESGHTYEVYQIFAGDYYESVGLKEEEHGTLSNVVWGSGIDAGKKTALLTELKAYVANPDVEDEDPNKQPFADCETAADVAEVLGEHETLAEPFAKIVSNYLSTDENDKTIAVQGEQADTDGVISYTASDLADGYYFVLDTVKTGDEALTSYSKFILQVVDDAEVLAKTDSPEIGKWGKDSNEVGDDGNSVGYGTTGDVEVGDTVDFRVIAYIPDMTNYEKYYFGITDTMSKGLTYVENSAKVYIVSKEGNTKENLKDWTADASKENTTLTGNTWLTITENDDDTLKNTTIAVGFFDGDEANQKKWTNIKPVVVGNDNENETGCFLILDYQATVNDLAVTEKDAITNEVELDYSNNPNEDSKGTTPQSEVELYTFDIDVFKVAADDPDVMLEGAEFALFKDKETAKEVAENPAAKDASDALMVADALRFDFDEVKNTYNLRADQTAKPDDTKDAYTLKTNGEGTFNVDGLDEGTYYLVELKAPDGYNRIKEVITVEVKVELGDDENEEKSVTVTYYVGDDENEVVDGITNDVTIANNKGTTLPETGGIGTTILYAGGILAMAAGVFYITMNRKKQHQ